MNYVSTRNSSNSFKFEDVFIKGLADDGGLFIPKSLHEYSQKDLLKFKKLEYKELAKEYDLSDELSHFKERFDNSNEFIYLVGNSLGKLPLTSLINCLADHPSDLLLESRVNQFVDSDKIKETNVFFDRGIPWE